jgi:GxxExxY protein
LWDYFLPRIPRRTQSTHRRRFNPVYNSKKIICGLRDLCGTIFSHGGHKAHKEEILISSIIQKKLCGLRDLCGTIFIKKFEFVSPLGFLEYLNISKFNPMTENELATIAVDICFQIHKELGPGLLESVYESAFAYELTIRKIPFTRQQGIHVHYQNVKMDDIGFRADIIMENKLLIEIKSVEALDKKAHKIVLTYMRFAAVKLAILVNFNVDMIKEGIHRKIQGHIN